MHKIKRKIKWLLVIKEERKSWKDYIPGLCLDFLFTTFNLVLFYACMKLPIPYSLICIISIFIVSSTLYLNFINKRKEKWKKNSMISRQFSGDGCEAMHSNAVRK